MAKQDFSKFVLGLVATQVLDISEASELVGEDTPTITFDVEKERYTFDNVKSTQGRQTPNLTLQEVEVMFHPVRLRYWQQLAKNNGHHTLADRLADLITGGEMVEEMRERNAKLYNIEVE